MTVKQIQIPLRTGQRSEWIDITEEIRRVVSSSGISNGICTVNSLHTTAAVTINENADLMWGSISSASSPSLYPEIRVSVIVRKF